MIERMRTPPPAAALGDSIEERVLMVGARTFNTNVESLTLESDASNTAGWNSLAHVEFLLARISHRG
jgi:hypothetical protein